MTTNKKHLKVLHLRSSGALLGAENVVLEIAQHSPKFGIDSFIGIPVLKADTKPDFAIQAEKKNLNVSLFNYDSIFSPALAKSIKRFVVKNKIDIIHAHGYQEDFYAWFAKLNIPKIATNHLWKKTDLKLQLYTKLDSLILKSFDQVVAVSHPIHDELIDAGIAKNKIKLISNGINIDKFPTKKDKTALLKLKRSLGIDPDTLVLGMVSSLSFEKGHGYMLEAYKNAFSKLNTPVKLLIVGDGNYKNEIAQKAKSLYIENQVVFTGTRRDIPDILSIIDIYVISSLIEGLPMSLLEAMASQLPVIATQVGDIDSVIEDDVNGYLVAPKDTNRISERLITLVNNPDIRKRISANARTIIEEKYSSSQMTESYSHLYHQILAQ